MTTDSKDGISPTTTGIQTRYSFYEAQDPENESLIKPPNSKSADSVTDAYSESEESLDNQKKNPSVIAEGSGRETCVSNPTDTSEVEDMLKMLTQAQEIELRNKTKKPPFAPPSDTRGRPPMHERIASGLSSFSTSAVAGAPSNRMDDSDGTDTNAHEKAIREALLYIRRRGHERAAMAQDALNVSTSMSCDPIPVHPNIDGVVPMSSEEMLATATKLDNRLLSPPADVRKAASDMFRHHDEKVFPGTEEQIGIELAKPIYSIPAPHGGESPMHPPGKSSQFSVVPSSPAPGKFNSIDLVNGVLQQNTMQETETPDSRRLMLELERRTRRELEIEVKVEQVLLAILQKVNHAEKEQWEEGGIESLLSALFAEPAIPHEGVTVGKMRPTRVDSDIEDEHIIAPDLSNKSESMDNCTSAVEDLLAEHSNHDDDEIRGLSSPFSRSTISEYDNVEKSPQTAQDFHGHDSENTSIRDGLLEVEAVDRGSPEKATGEGYFHETTDEKHDEMVLGPLSKEMGGTTGVVLQHDGSDSGDSDESETAASPSLISSITSTARRTQHLLASKLSFSSGKDVCENLSPIKSPTDVAESLVEELYAHILVRHQSQKQAKKETFSSWKSDKFSGSSKPLTDRYIWDDEDPDELGYIVHTLSKVQVHEIEQNYEMIMDRLGSEYAEKMKKDQGIFRKKNVTGLERDLDEAERMLGHRKEEGKGAKKNEAKMSKSEGGESKDEQKDADALATNPNFPGAKAAGTGEVGELEIYHLPIIYKAHQTGFEPTKDLVLQPDSVFAGQYYVQSELGSAAFSTAYRCVDLNSGKKAHDGEVYYDEVCLKVIKNTKDFFDQSLDEIKILELLRQTGQCNEHNILEMKAFFYHKEHLIIVTELLRQNLFEFGKYILEHDEPPYFTRSRLCYIARQCLVALSFVHKLGLVHSDIKPENILLASYSRARVKVIDFGSSCYLTDRQSSYIQSRSYRAPEVILGLPYDGKIDVWSLGCVIAEMYTGQVTFQNDSVVSMLSRIEAICGAFPRYMIDNGRQSVQFFTPTGLLYEKIEADDDSGMRMENSRSFADDDSDADNTIFNIFQPKTTTMAERLGFEPDLLEKKRKRWEEEEKALFVDFVTKLLTIDPEKRPTADEALEHPWILSGFNLSEDDLKYPPE